jgi:hypothetical protein
VGGRKFVFQPVELGYGSGIPELVSSSGFENYWMKESVEKSYILCRSALANGHDD